jgi:hypothetical protein
MKALVALYDDGHCAPGWHVETSLIVCHWSLPSNDFHNLMVAVTASKPLAAHSTARVPAGA